MKIRKILLPTDLSESVEPAKNFAASLAKQNAAELLLLHSIVTHPLDFREGGSLVAEFFDKIETQSQAELEKQCGALKKEGLAARYQVERRGSAFEVILDKIASWRPDVVVMGTHGLSGIDRWLFGSLAEKVVRHAPVPVVTVRPDAEVRANLETILVPIDFSDNARRAVAAASGFGGPKAKFILLHVVLNPAFTGVHPAEYIRIFGADPALPDRLRERMKEWDGGMLFETDVREADDVAQCILDVARERSADAIAIGTRGLTGFDHFLLGSVAEKVVRAARVPVLSVK